MVSSASHPEKAMPSSKLVSPRFTGGRGMSAASTCPAAKISPIQAMTARTFPAITVCLACLIEDCAFFLMISTHSPFLFAKVDQYFLEQYLDQFGAPFVCPRSRQLGDKLIGRRESHARPFHAPQGGFICDLGRGTAGIDYHLHVKPFLHRAHRRINDTDIVSETRQYQIPPSGGHDSRLVIGIVKGVHHTKALHSACVLFRCDLFQVFEQRPLCVLFHAAGENQGHIKCLCRASQRTGIVPDQFLRDVAAPTQGSNLVINEQHGSVCCREFLGFHVCLLYFDLVFLI